MEDTFKKIKCFYCLAERNVRGRVRKIICDKCVRRGMSIEDDEERKMFFKFDKSKEGIFAKRTRGLQ